MNEAIRVSLISLGCARNLVDSEVLLGHAVEEGLQVVKDPEDADVVVVNTCGFIDSAKQESIDTILSVARLKGESGLKGVVAVGCLAAASNLYALAKIVRALTEPGASKSVAGWSIAFGLKLLLLFGGLWLLLSWGVVTALPLAVGYGTLPIGIAIGSLVSDKAGPSSTPPEE